MTLSPPEERGTGRSVPMWIGATPDAKVPPHVRARIFDRHKGVCAISGRKIRPGEAWQLDHEKPLHLGGAHSELNLRPVLTTEHRVKSADEQRAKGKADRIRRKHLGLEEPKSGFRGWRNFAGEIIWKDDR